MPYLVLDLDETTFVIHREENLQKIHNTHYIWNSINATLDQKFSCQVGIINPKPLVSLLEAASQSDGLIILTGSYWDKEIMVDIINAMQFEFVDYEKVKKMIDNALFYSPQQEEIKYQESKGLSIDSRCIRLMKKSDRLYNIVEMENLQNKEFVVLDNESQAIESFRGMDNVIAIRATTDIDDTSFYKKAIDSLSNSYPHTNERRLGEKYQHDWQMISNPAPKKPCIEPEEDREFSSFIEELLADESSYGDHDPFILDTPPSKTIKEKVEDLSKSWPTQWSTDLEELNKLKEFTSYLIKNCEFKLKYSLIYNYFILFQPTTSEKLKKIIELTDFPQRIQLIRELNKTLALNIQLEEDRNKTIGNKTSNTIDSEIPLKKTASSAKESKFSFKIGDTKFSVYKPSENGEKASFRRYQP